MKCHRCGSLMVFERFYGPNEYFLGWRCVLCGEIIDQIQENRQWLKIGGNQNRLDGRHSVVTYKDGVGFEWDGM